MHPDCKLRTVEYIDPIISAEIPDKDEDPELYDIVSEFMMHGLCGIDNPRCQCMVDNKCSNNYPMKIQDHTGVDSNGYPVYRRRDNGSYVDKGNVMLDNRSVVPYHKGLLKNIRHT